MFPICTDFSYQPHVKIISNGQWGQSFYKFHSGLSKTDYTSQKPNLLQLLIFKAATFLRKNQRKLNALTDLPKTAVAPIPCLTVLLFPVINILTCLLCKCHSGFN
ncbi:hypothetical protein V8G54_017821 [Vigna mungo]|uniref:Uncharacterized protein n=1 Tax=Vigna mungo TaxID=3915 RepID=A0AAQ3S2E1_VIGMU